MKTQKKQLRLPLNNGAQPTRTPAQRVRDAISRQLADLYARWEDEHGYEDWADYQLFAKKRLDKEGGVYVDFTSSPFVLTFRVLGEREVYQVRVTATPRAIRVTGPLTVPVRRPPDGVLAQDGPPPGVE